MSAEQRCSIGEVDHKEHTCMKEERVAARAYNEGDRGLSTAK